MNRQTPDARLCAAADLVRQGAVFADIGTDHAYLPVFLMQNGRIDRAYACDINQGPLDAAAQTVADAALQQRITLVLTDGLQGLDGKGITDIAVCGMGGELIARILDDAPFIKDPSIRLVLQPMSRAAVLRSYLAEQGFAITHEVITEAGGRLYFCFAACYTGMPYTLDRLEAEMGKLNLEKRPRDPLFAEFLRQKAATQQRKVDGLMLGGVCDQAETDYLAALCQAMEKESI